jgi:hypothetical protein
MVAQLKFNRSQKVKSDRFWFYIAKDFSITTIVLSVSFEVIRAIALVVGYVAMYSTK